MASGGDLTLTILGFLNEQPMHGYELKARLAALTGHLRPISDGALYPAISRLEAKGLVERHEEAGAGAARKHVLTLTGKGREELLRRLREPGDLDVSDQTRFFALLTFLSALPDPADQARVLSRRLAFLEAPASFFYEGGRPVRIKDEPDPYRRGMLEIARASSRAEKEWLRQRLEELPEP
ncbi:MAG: PadR family transcriptional regulator [Nonomuraea sp.]|nr:PadR family transcriptional regulator [Nonomuraea sp.]NUP67138.1 PadR family transcriptional regulator [Nonomuraea sp.]NUP78103.1 PadR family transcriptional regulator [Nonomuraea sp.]NUS05233.1 PadR family transcriptional regulator [Nonomuraea sp.]NUT12829.1 PadR family transcriptional regulator [Nonomuraea sp.]